MKKMNEVIQDVLNDLNELSNKPDEVEFDLGIDYYKKKELIISNLSQNRIKFKVKKNENK